MEFVKIVAYIGYLFLFINIVVYLTGFLKKDKTYKSFTMYLVFLGIVELITEIHASKGLNNHYLATYYLFVQFIFLSLFFYFFFLNTNKVISSVVKFTSILIMAGLALQYAFKPQLYYTFNSVGFLVTSAILIVYALFYFYELLTKKRPFIYIVSGIFIYLISSALIFASIDLIILRSDISFLVWKINAVLFVIYQLLILWEWMQGRMLKQGQ